jgi:AGCS family alanine or glycine:cation symporter
VVLVVSVFLKTETIWALAETVNGLMAIPNLIGLWLLCPLFVRLTRQVRKTAATDPDLHR